MSRSLRLTVSEVFGQSQKGVTAHEKLFKQLKQLYSKVDEDEFLSEFIRCLQFPLIYGDKHRSVENVLNFAAKFIALLLQNKDAEAKSTDEEEEICPFVLNVLKFLFENQNSENQSIRFRICQFINKILNNLGNEACLDDNLCDDISECMMERLQDKAPAVRMQAVLALHRLQDPSDPACTVMKAFLFHVSTDPNADVRRAVITNLAITAASVRCLLERTHDCKDVVRRAAYISLSKLGVARFAIIQRVRLITNGLKDHSGVVRDAVSKVMLPAWLQFYKGSILALLHALDCENSTDISILTLQSLFKTESMKSVLGELTGLLNEDKVIPLDSLNPDSALFWRVLVEYLEAHPEIAENRPVDEPLPELLPELSTFCNYIKEYYTLQSAKDEEHWVKLQHHYVLTQLLQLCKSFDYADEMGRSNLRNLCLHLLTNNSISENVVPVVVELMVKIIPNVEDRLQALAEAISEVREPMIEQEVEPSVTPEPTFSREEIRQRELKQASIRVKINVVEEEQGDAVREKDFEKAKLLQEECNRLQLELEALMETPVPAPAVVNAPPPQVRDPVKDEMALRKCLRIVREMVQSDTVQTLSATLQSLMQHFVLPCLQEDNSNVIRNKALECLGLFCLLDKPLAQKNFVMFCFQIANDDVCEVALKVTFDLLHLYGLETFQIQEDNGESTEKKKRKKKKNLFVTDMFGDEFDTEEEESQETQTNISSGSSGNTSNLISMLTSLLDSTSTSMRNLAMEGLYKLLFACRISSPVLLSRLILMWYSPVTDGDETLRQPLGVFLQVYASQCPRSQETLEQAFLPTLKTLINAPVTSPLTQIDMDSVARLFISLTRPGQNKSHSKMVHIHNNMAISICNAIMDSDNTTTITCLLKALNSLELALDDPVYRDSLKTLVMSVHDIFRVSKEKQFIRSLDKIIAAIEAAMENVSMRTNEVDNTAASSQLEGTQLAGIDKTIDSECQDNEKQNKNARLLHPRMHSILAENEIAEEDDDEEEENSQKTPSSVSSFVVPPSPPRTQPSDSDEESAMSQENESNKAKKQKVDDNSANDPFKKPSGKPSKARTRDQIRSASSSDADNSPLPKRRKPASEEEPSKTTRPTRGKDEGKAEESVKSKTGLQEQKSAAVKRTAKGVTKDVPERQSSPKRQISPTEKGATLKTFQNITGMSPSVTPPPKRVKKAAQATKSIGGAEMDISTVAQPSETSRDGTPRRTRSSLSVPDRNSIDSPPASAAELRRNKSSKNAHRAVKESEKVSSAPDGPSTQRSKKQKEKSALASPPSSGLDVDSDSSPAPRRVRQITKTVEADAKRPSRNAGSQSSPDVSPAVSPAVSTRSGRTRRMEESPLASRSESTVTDSDSSPAPAPRQKAKSKGKPAVSSPKMMVFMKRITPSKLQGIVPIRNTRRSVSQSDASDSQPDQPAPRSTRQRMAISDDDTSSPQSAASQKQKAAKSGRPSPTKTNVPVNPKSNSDKSPVKGLPKEQVGKKTKTSSLKSASSESPGSDSLPSTSRATRGKTTQAESTVPVEKGKKRATSTDSPMSEPSRRSLRSQVETPSPRTRSGKI